ncbi:MAG: transporter substrate-binding domain-containing protein [Acetatifactor sp.]|nr:transporter substrate-binding domain-containing protein [Acetatifactor sp.]
MKTEDFPAIPTSTSARWRHTGWEYEYVEGMWSDLLEMLEKGEIDLLSDVSYTEERANYMLYASLPMGTESSWKEI